MLRKLARSLLVVIAAGHQVFAQGLPVEKILLPVAIQTAYVEEIPGRFGSRWTTRIAIFNATDHDVRIFGYEQGCQLGACGVIDTPPGTTVRPKLDMRAPEIPAHFLFVDRRYSNQVNFYLKVLDRSRQSDIEGTEIPVIRESELLTTRTNLLAVRNGEGVRAIIRLYDFDSRSGAEARVRFYAVQAPEGFTDPMQRDQFVFETNVTFATTVSPAVPGYAELDLSNAAALQPYPLLRVEVEPITPGLRFWTFASVTNNATQQLTTIQPH